MITDRHGRRRRFIYERDGVVQDITAADIPERSRLARPGEALAPGTCALIGGEIVVQHVEILQRPDDFGPRDITQRFAAQMTGDIAQAYRAGMIAALKLRRAR